MTEVQKGHILGLQTVKNGGLTYQGKPLEFECVNEEERVYQARAELTQEEIDAGNNTEQVFTVQFPVGEAVVNQTTALPKLLEQKNKNFKNMTDAEKHTYINSLEYTTGRTQEPRQIADGSFATTTGVKANEAKGKSTSALEKEKSADGSGSGLGSGVGGGNNNGGGKDDGKEKSQNQETKSSTETKKASEDSPKLEVLNKDKK